MKIVRYFYLLYYSQIPLIKKTLYNFFILYLIYDIYTYSFNKIFYRLYLHQIKGFLLYHYLKVKKLFLATENMYEIYENI